MGNQPLKSLADYSRLLAELLDRPDVAHSTVVVWSDIKRNRVPAPEIGFTRPNLPVLIREIEELAKRESV